MDRDPIEHQEFVDRKRAARMRRVDAMPAELRELVHEYGLPVVRACLDLGVRKPNQIRHLVETILDEFLPTRGSYSKQGLRTEKG
jgi:hypothetical protein